MQSNNSITKQAIHGHGPNDSVSRRAPDALYAVYDVFAAALVRT